MTPVTSLLHRLRLQGLVLAGLLVASLASRAATGTDHGFFWQNYVSGGTSAISFPQAGTYPGNFAVTYAKVGDVVAGKGWNPGSSTRVINYKIDALSGSFNFVGVYGWTTNPLVEYYVCELGSISYGATNVGTMASDGHVYTLWKRQRTGFPSIIGTATYWQYMSQWGGTTIGTNRKVTIGNHMSAWTSRMGSMGTNNFQIFAIEAFDGRSGYINATVW